MRIPVYIGLIGLASALSGCESDGLEAIDIEVPEGYALSAGTSTLDRKSVV